MPIDPNIALSVKPPELTSPLATIGGLMQLRNMGSEIALRNQQIAASQQQQADVAEQAAQRQRDNEGARTLQGLMKDPANYTRIAKGDYAPIYGAGVSPTVTQNAIKNLDEQRKTALGLEEGKAKLYAEGRGVLQKMLEGVNAEADDEISASQYNSARQTLAQQFPDIASKLPILTPGQGYRQQLNNLINTNGFHHAMLEDAAGIEAKKAQTSKEAADAALAKAKTPGEVAESSKKELVTQAMKDALANPQQGAALIDGALPATLDPQVNASYKAAWQAAMQSGNIEGAAHIVAAAAGHAAKIAEATNPIIRQGKAAEAAAVENATLPGKVATAAAIERATGPIRTANEVQKQIEIAKNSPDAFAPVVDPRSRMQAIGNYEKDSKEYADKVADAQRLKDFIAAAQSGNKAAPGLIPMSEVRMLVNRVNRQELQGVSSAAGSAKDRVEGFLGKWTEGQPIPPAILKDTAAIADTMAAAARRTYEYKVQVTNNTYGSKAKPIDFQQPATPAAQYVREAQGPNGHTIGQKADGGWYDIQTGQKVQ